MSASKLTKYQNNFLSINSEVITKSILRRIQYEIKKWTNQMNKTSKGCLFKQKEKKKLRATRKEVTLQDCRQTLLLSMFIVKCYN